MALLLNAPASLSRLCCSSPQALSTNKPHFNLLGSLRKNPRSKSLRSGVRRAAPPSQEPAKIQEEAADIQEEGPDYELTEVEKSLAKVFQSRLWFVFLFVFLIGMYVYFITAGNGSSYIPMMRYQYNYQR